MDRRRKTTLGMASKDETVSMGMYDAKSSW